MQPACLLIAIFALAHASQSEVQASLRAGAAGAVRETRKQRTAFLSLTADTQVDDSFLSVAESSRDNESTSSQNGTLSTDSAHQSCTGSTPELLWDRQVGVYCTAKWDPARAKANGVNAQACMQQCLATKGCEGVSVTNQNWGDRSPWCHFCYGSATKDHANLDTYWRECVTATKREERDLAAKLKQIVAIEQRLCSAPGEVSAKEFQMIGDKAKLEKAYSSKHKEVVADKEKELAKLQQRQIASEQDCKSLGQKFRDKYPRGCRRKCRSIEDCNKIMECAKMEDKYMVAENSAHEYRKKIGELENSGKREKEREERALEMELKSIHTQMKELKAKENAKAERLKGMQESQDAMSWDDFGFSR